MKFSWGGMPPDPPSRRATRALIAYWNPPFENSRSATGIKVSGWGWIDCAVSSWLDENIPLASRVTHTGSTFAFRKRWGQIDWRSLGE